MKEIIWVFGTSGSGKETFIKNVAKTPDLLQRLGWTAKKLAASESSLINIGQFDDDPVIHAREQILSEVPQLLGDADIALIKWQLVDSQATRPERLRALLPEAKHRIVELKAPKDELIERLKAKPWWHDSGQESEFIDAETGLVVDSIQKLGEGFETVVLNSSATSSYNQLK